MTVILIRSQMVHGCIGNSAAALPMQASGLTVATVPPILLSNHAYYPTMRGNVLEENPYAHWSELLKAVCVEELTSPRRIFAPIVVDGLLTDHQEFLS